MKDLNYYINCFSTLHTMKVQDKPAPHKALLLLSVIDLVEQGFITDSRVMLSDILEKQFKHNAALHLGNNSVYDPKINYPYYHMRSEPFWELVSTTANPVSDISNYSTANLKKNIAYARIDTELQQLLKDSNARVRLRTILISNYIVPLNIMKKENLQPIDNLTSKDLDLIGKLNKLLKNCQGYGDTYKRLIGKGVSNIANSFASNFKTDIPTILECFFEKNIYKIKSSVGQGRVTQCPWIAIMHTDETQSTQEGVYIVFLFSEDLKTVYITLAQGVTKTSPELISAKRDQIRKKIKVDNELLKESNKLEISNQQYQNSAIYSNEWPINDNEKCLIMINKFKEAYEEYIATKDQNKTQMEEISDKTISKKDPHIKSEMSPFTVSVPFSINSIIEFINQTGLLDSPSLIKRFAFSLMAKRFLILSGLAGSGKTQLALAFARALVEDMEKQLCMVSVGADWTNREPLLGYPNALKSGEYIKPENGVLDLLIEANKPENASKPFFLILDEMNLSYVERYFADFLSAMESREAIALWKECNDESESCECNVPERIGLPDNLFIIGTINVDETTYMFSPKVLDRANVIEFKISVDEMSAFLDSVKQIDCLSIYSKAAGMGADFVKLANCKEFDNEKSTTDTLKAFFTELKNVNAEFGYRSATEIFRFISQAHKNDDTDKKMSEEEILDAAIIQKLLPKLHGSRKKLEPALKALWRLCFAPSIKDTMQIAYENIDKAIYKESADKIFRMYESAYANGFTSFAEA